ncbi:helix-turn-helix domain-containing protein [Flavobacterium rhizosphaerae]|uniref:Helix-turn-helix domain-containing protein n=1 Tax=Flavobacterium rhizosphaerae TaxID=3163298 RepID=A0ABW8YWV9_9FLAO
MSKLKQIRELQNLTQEELSANSGISVRTIQRIESGVIPKGHTLKALTKALNVAENELSGVSVKTEDIRVEENHVQVEELSAHIDYQRLKLINLSSILFVILPPLNILVPFILSRLLRQNNLLLKQIISLQILWTVLAPIFFILGILLKLGHSFTIVLIAAIALSNVFLILANLAELDRNKKLRFRLKFSVI